jgi:hypothetical protein
MIRWCRNFACCAVTRFSSSGNVLLWSTSFNKHVPRLNEKSIELWYQFESRVFAALVLCFGIAYKKHTFSALGKRERAMLKRLLPADYANELATEEIL